jgi:hypothetical protein
MQPHCLCINGLSTLESDRLSNPSNDLQGEASDVIKLPDSSTQTPVCPDGVCVSPVLLIYSQ